MTVLEILEGARKLPGSPACWIKGASAHDANGKPVGADDPDACCWCLDGALHKVAGTSRPNSTYWDALKAVGKQVYDHPCTYGYAFPAIRFNDYKQTTHAEVLAALDEAIAEERRS